MEEKKRLNMHDLPSNSRESPQGSTKLFWPDVYASRESKSTYLQLTSQKGKIRQRRK